jgi:hypothetical protein
MRCGSHRTNAHHWPGKRSAAKIYAAAHNGIVEAVLEAPTADNRDKQ